MPSECCYFVDKAAAADAAPALYYFGSILHCPAVFTQNLGQTHCFAARSHSAILDGFISHYRTLVKSASSATSYSVRFPSEYLLDSTIRLFHQMGQIFRNNAAPPSNPMGIRIDSKRRKKLIQKRLAMGHKQDDHEQEQGYNLDIR